MQTVLIHPTGQVDANDRVVPVSKLENENIRWRALGNGGPWKITFDKNPKGSPFTQTVYDIPQGGEIISQSGPIGGQRGQTYSYNVRNGITNIITDDPDVDVE